MASNFHFLKTSFMINIMILIMSLFTIPSLNLQTPSISAAPALLPNPPLSSPYTELSPDISPLLPSPGGNALSPADPSLPTIPSTRTPNPDATGSVGPDAALAPTGTLIQVSSAVLLQDSLVKGFGVAQVFSVYLVSLLGMTFIMI